MGRGDILALVAIVLIISAFAYYAYQQYTFSRTGRVILVEYRASKAWRKGDTWYFQSQSFSAGHVVDYHVFTVFRITIKETNYIKVLVEAWNVSYIRLATGKNSFRGYIRVSEGRHIVEIFFNKTTITAIQIDGKHTRIIEYGPWGYKGCAITMLSSSNQNHILAVRFLEVRS